MSTGSSRIRTRPELVKLTGEISDIRLTTETGYARYSGGRYSTHVTPQSKQVGAITLRVSGRPVTCVVNMYTRFIGVMVGNTVTVWGRVRKWDTGSDVPQSVDVERLEVEETGEVHPQGLGMSAVGIAVIPIVFVLIFFVVIFFFILGPMGIVGSFPFFPFTFIWVFFAVFVIIAMIPAILVALYRSKRLSPSQMADYVEVPSYGSEAAPTIEKESAPPTVETCSFCGATVKDRKASYCWNCGGRLSLDSAAPKGTGQKCMVCNLALRKSDASVHCPYCGNSAHRIHMLEWLHTHDFCPVCRRHLDEQSF